MSECFIPVRHHVDDYECMWNGIEDLYMERTGEILPDFFFFSMAGVGNFIDINTPASAIKRMPVWNDGRTDKMYERLAPVIGMSYRHYQGTKFSTMLNRAKKEIDNGRPVVLGCLDMYYLEYYPKFFYKEHIPIHYVLMTGYHDEKQCAYIQDCGVLEVQPISYDLLSQALSLEKTDLSDKNGMYAIRFEERLPSVREIAGKALLKKAEGALKPPAGFLGIKGMRKLSREFESWKQAFSEEEYRAILVNMVTFTGTVPILPDRLLPAGNGNGILHMAAREKLSNVLFQLSERYEVTDWRLSADKFLESGGLIARMTDRVCDYLLGEAEDLTEIPKYILEMAEMEEEAFRFMLNGARYINDSFGGGRDGIRL